ncbi:MAG: fasciclin domain-containing protein [Marinifilaceae bacterium]
MVNFKMKLICLFSFLITCISCEKEMDKYYERPDWLPGSSWNVLSARGNYSLFLSGVERAEMKTIVAGRGLCTVFAPNDEAIMEYLKSRGYSAIDDMPIDELKEWIGYHILEYSYSRSQLVAFNPSGIENTEKPTGQYYKHKTFSRSGMETIVDPISSLSRTVLRQERYLPVISGLLLDSYKLSDPAYNYNYFYPKTAYKAGLDNVQVGNANVIEYELPSDNGYVHLIDEALEPLRTVYDVLNDESLSFSRFRSMYDRFSLIEYNKNFSQKYQMDSLFLYHHNRLPMIASEWTFNYEGGFTSNVGKASGNSYNAFVPTNKAMDSFMDSFFGEISDPSTIDLLTLYYFFSNHVLDQKIIFPEQIKNGTCRSPYGDNINFNVDASVHKEICGNGTFYGIDEVVVPAMFKSVTKPLFQSDNYSIFRYLLHNAGEIIQLINPSVEFTLLAPTNEAFEAMGIRLNLGDPLKYGDEKLEIASADDPTKFSELNAQKVAELASYHILLEPINTFNELGIFKTKGNRSYIKVFNGGVLGEIEGSESLPVNLLGNIPNGITNGAIYSIDNVLTRPTETIMEMLSSRSDYSSFYGKLKDAGLVETINGAETIAFITGETVMCMLPTNDVVASMNFPDDREELIEYLKYFFISLESNDMVDYVLPGIGEESNYKTLAKDLDLSNGFETIYMDMNIEFGSDFNLLLTHPHSGKTVQTVRNTYPIFAVDGVIYHLESADIQ